MSGIVRSRNGPAGGLRSERGGESRWDRLREQYARAGYLSWVGHETARSLLRSRKGGEKPGGDGEFLAQCQAAEGELLRESADELRSRALRLRGQAPEEVSEAGLVNVFALVREVSRRVLGLRHHDVQLLGGLALCRGALAEMATGEGKTLVQSLAAYALGLQGKGVHVATANSYLAARDHEFAKPLYHFLGVSSALLPERQPASVKRGAYAADITYGTGTEYGFDYLRDQLALLERPSSQPGERFSRSLLGEQAGAGPGAGICQRGLHFAIIDEVDSVLIDEATTPLVISRAAGDEHPAPGAFLVARDVAAALEEGSDFVIDRVASAVRFTARGEERMQSGEWGIPWGELRRPWCTYVENALRARWLLLQDVAYVVQKGKVVIIDEFTGRARGESSWRQGLHQAVEAQAGVAIRAEAETVASVSRQRFYRLYGFVAGMTGTARSAAGEFWEVFRRPVVEIPRHLPSRAVVLPARVFVSEACKFRAIAADIAGRHREGQPVLVGSRTIRNSEAIAVLLREEGIPHRVLNARQDAEEAVIVGGAGKRGAVTIATNMAGRGTHISLGEGVAELGGLHVIAVEMEESRRIDLQLTGRSARQGQPGSSQLYLSAEDHLIRRYAPEGAARLAAAAAGPDGEVAGSEWESVFRRAQRQAEAGRYAARVSLIHRDKWLSETKLHVG